MKILANHAHVFRKDQREDGTVEALLRTMDECGIDQCVCFAPFAERGLPYDPNVFLYEEIKSHENLIGFGVIDFSKDNPSEQVRKIYDLGLKGIKLHPAFQKFKVDSADAFEVYKVAEELGLFLSFHTGIHWHRIKDYEMLLFDEVAYHYPNLCFSMEHVGGYCFFNEALAVLLNNRKKPPRVYAGLTSVFDNDVNRFWYLDDQKIRDLLHLAGDDVCIFGLDFPYNKSDKIKAAIAHVKQMDVSEETKEKILGGNLRRGLRL